MPRDEGSRGHLAVSENGGGGLDVGGLLAELKLMVGSVADNTAPKPARAPVPWEAAHPVPILGNIQLTAGAGTTDQAANVYGPNDPYYWDIRRLSVWGFTAGTVTAYLNSASGEQLGVAPSAGQFTWSSQVLLAPRDHLVFVAASITGTVTFGGQAIEVKSEWLPAYLM